jgi:hypothetical protein
LTNTGQGGGTAGADIKAPDAWNIFTGSASIKIAIIDNGVLTNHEELSGKASGDAPVDIVYHGTHVAGIAAAKANNEKGGRGVDWNAQIISKRIFSPTYDGDAAAASKIMSAVDGGAHILNNSWGGNSSTWSTTLRIAFAYAYNMNRVSVVSMGNHNGSQTRYPAGFGQGIIAVGSTQNTDLVSSFSNTGSHITVVAPGGGDPPNDANDIWSTWGPNSNSYAFEAGTSMAAPVVSGIASLLKGYNSNLDNDDIENIIKLSADKVRPDIYSYTNGWNNQMGYGRVNAKKALDLLRTPYRLNHYTYAGGTSTYLSDYEMWIYGAAGLVDGRYIGRRYAVQTTITLPDGIEKTVWGRGVATAGWSGATNNYAMGYCEVVNNTQTSVTLETFVYDMYQVNGPRIGWFPCSPSNVVFAYTVLDKEAPPLTSAIEGSSCIALKSGTHTWYADVSGGIGYYGYQWIADGSVVGTGSSVTLSRGPNFTLNLTVTSGYQAASSSLYVSECSGGGGDEKTVAKTETEIVPDNFELHSNFPNPFNPSTTIRFGLPSPSNVSLKVYNIQGQEVRTLVNDHLSGGYFDAIWDGKDEAGSQVASGIYIYRLQAGNFVQSKKMTYIK